MSLLGRREKRENKQLREDKERLIARIDELKERCADLERNPAVAKRREIDMADRILTLERQVITKDTAIKRLSQQLDDAIGNRSTEGDLDAAGDREKTRRAAAAAARGDL
ncbi:hypothetical protein PV350_45450 [Streptomyces sp. PA03-6a]|nr:hypothetical protein [Streptomyces sp. PA03-6a]